MCHNSQCAPAVRIVCIIYGSVRSAVRACEPAFLCIIIYIYIHMGVCTILHGHHPRSHAHTHTHTDTHALLLFTVAVFRCATDQTALRGPERTHNYGLISVTIKCKMRGPSASRTGVRGEGRPMSVRSTERYIHNASRISARNRCAIQL